MEPIKEKNRKTQVAGICNLIFAGLCVAFLIAIILGIASGLFSYEGDDAGEGISYAFLVIIFMPVTLVALFGIGIPNAIHATVRGIRLIRLSSAGGKIGRGSCVASTILKVLHLIIFATGGLNLYMILELVSPLVAVIYAAAAGVIGALALLLCIWEWRCTI